jgi:O-antigen/teichoic acid export membrane protein
LSPARLGLSRRGRAWLSKLETSPIARNVAWLGAVQAANILAPLVVLPILLRRLGVAHFGQYILGQTIIGVCVIIVDWGFNITATQNVAANRDDPFHVTRIFSEVMSAKFLLAVGVSVIVFVGVETLTIFRLYRSVILSYMPWIVGSALFPQWLFQGLERMGLLLACVLAGRCLVIPLTFALVHRASDTWIAGLLNSSATVVMGLTALTLVARSRLAGWKSPSIRDVGAALAAGWHVFIGTLATSLYSTMNNIILAGLTGPADVGLFGVADKIKTFVQTPITPWSSAVFPRVSREMAKDPAAGLRLVLHILALTAAGTFCLSLGLFVGARTLVEIVAGPGYQNSVPVLHTLACLPFVIGVNTVLGLHLMLPLGMKRAFGYALLAGGVLNLGLLLVLAPPYGAVGAAGAVVITEVVVTLIMATCVYARCRSLLSLERPAIEG